MVLINKYELEGTITEGTLVGKADYKIIIEEYWETTTYDGEVRLYITPAVYYYGEEDEIEVGTKAHFVTLTIDGTTYDPFWSDLNGTTFYKNQWNYLNSVRGHIDLVDDCGYVFGTPIHLESMVNIRGSNDDERLIRRLTIETDFIVTNQSQYIMTDADKQALMNGSAIVLSKINVLSNDPSQPKAVLTENSGIKSWDYNDDCFVEETSSVIGEFVARELSGELEDMSDIFSPDPFEEANTVELQLGVIQLSGDVTIHNYTDEDVNWYTLGTFIITEPTDEEVKDNTSFEAFDKAVMLNQPFNADFVNTDFQKSFNTRIAEKDYFTALELAKYACIQYGVVFGSTWFTNCDALITSNQFTTGDTCRDVMKALAKLAYGYCKMGWDDKCYIKELSLDYNNISTYNTLTPNHYYTMKTTNEQYGPVNYVAIGMEYIEGQDSVVEDDESIAENGLWNLEIMDNPILYTQELRDTYSEKAVRLFGLKFMEFETETIGHPWLQGNEPILLVDMDGNSHISYPFNLTISYNGHIKTTISAPMKTENDRGLSYKTTQYKEIRKIGITVDRQAGEISTMNSLLKTTADGLSSVETQYNELITDTYRKEEIQRIVTGIGVDGVKVTKVETNSATFDEEGMTYERLNAQTKTTINEVGVNVRDSHNQSIQFSGYVNENNEDYKEYMGQTIVGTDNIIVRRYANIGEHSRIQDYNNGGAIFWRG